MNSVHMPKVSFDWTINVTNLISILFFLATMIAGWYSLKAEVEVNQNTANLKFLSVEKALSDQQIINNQINQKIDMSSSDVKQALRDSTSDIKADIRELQVEIIKDSSARSR